MKSFPLGLPALALLLTGTLHAQYIPRAEFGDPAVRLRSTIDTNLIRTSIYNFGYSGRMGIGQGSPFEWPKNTGRDYIALRGMFVGGEVRDEHGDTIHIVSVPAFRQNLATGGDWNFNPIPEYMNPARLSIARSNDPTGWPAVWPDKLSDGIDPGWPGSWNGLYGKNQFFAGTELYYHYSDNVYNRYQYYPDSTNHSRAGLGIVVSERVIEWDDPLLKNVIITVSDIYNAGTRDLDKVGVTLWIADLIGGDGDSQDDIIAYNLQKRVVVMEDRDGISSNPAFQGAVVGQVGLAFLNTPDDLGIGSVQYVPAGAVNFSTVADAYLWSVMTPGTFVDTSSPQWGDYDLYASVGPFALHAGEAKRLTTALVFVPGQSPGPPDPARVYRAVDTLRNILPRGPQGNIVPVSLNSPAKGQVVLDTTTIRWNAGGGDTALKVSIMISSDFGDNWSMLAGFQPNSGSYQWSTGSFPVGIFYKLRLLASDTTSIGFSVMDSTFTIRSAQQVAPQVRLDKSMIAKSFHSLVPVRWMAGDADGDTVWIDLYCKIEGVFGWTPISAGVSNTGEYIWNSASFPEGSRYFIEARVRDGFDSVAVDSVGPFEVHSVRYGLSDSASVQRTTIGTGPIEVHIADTSQLTGHTYNLQFSVSADSGTRFAVIDQNTSKVVISDATDLRGLAEGPIFDGIRLFVRNDSLSLDTADSRWQRTGILKYQFKLLRLGFSSGVPELGDYDIEIGNVGLDTSIAITVSYRQAPSKPVNFRITNTLTGRKVRFGFFENDGTDGRFTAMPPGFGAISDLIVLLTTVHDSLVPSWALSLDPFSAGVIPAAGDSLRIRFLKPFQQGDMYRFQALRGNILAVREANRIPKGWELRQNYPNPFNPSTTIGFTLPTKAHVRLQIYNLLGQLVATLVDAIEESGARSAKWNAGNAPSGPYFYRLEATDQAHPSRVFTQVRKMVLVK